MVIDDKDPCPFCKSPFGISDGMKWGCTNDECPEQPRIHDPDGVTDYVESFWDLTLRTAYIVKRARLKDIQQMKSLEKYYI